MIDQAGLRRAFEGGESAVGGCDMSEVEYPDDADGAALRRVQAHGSDMTRPMDIDFAVSVPNEEAGQRVAEAAGARGYRTKVEKDDDSGEWTCYCSRRLVPEYEAILAAQVELDGLSESFGGYSDGWGTFGNAE
jgi:hypothetical protein